MKLTNNISKQLPDESAIHIMEKFNSEFEQYADKFHPYFNYPPEQLFTVDWACVWNLPQNVGKKVKIAFHTDKFAAVFIDDKFSIAIEYFYRLEDLTPIQN